MSSVVGAVKKLCAQSSRGVVEILKESLGSSIPLPTNFLGLESVDGFSNLQPSDPSFSSVSSILYVTMRDLVWCIDGFDIFVQCYDQFSVESVDKFVVDSSKLHFQIGAQLVVQFFISHVSLIIDELDSLPNSSTFDSVLNL
jgi:hypothetical protein